MSLDYYTKSSLCHIFPTTCFVFISLQHIQSFLFMWISRDSTLAYLTTKYPQVGVQLPYTRIDMAAKINTFQKCFKIYYSVLRYYSCQSSIRDLKVCYASTCWTAPSHFQERACEPLSPRLAALPLAQNAERECLLAGYSRKGKQSKPIVFSNFTCYEEHYVE